MLLKVIQVNVEWFRFFDELRDFLISENPDIINMQEVSDGEFWGDWSCDDYLDQLAKDLKMESSFHPTLSRVFAIGKVSYWEATLSRFPFVKTTKLILQDMAYREYPQDHGLFTADTKYDRYKYAQELPLWLLITHIDLWDIVIRNMCVHCHVSESCQETDEIYNDAVYINDHLQSDTNIPTLLTGDFNISQQSKSIELLCETMKHATYDKWNTLNVDIHPAFQNDLWPEWHGIDHVFTRDIEVVSCEVKKVDVSDHYPVVCELEVQ